MYDEINDMNLEAIQQILKQLQGNECSEYTKKLQGMHLRLCLITCNKK